MPSFSIFDFVLSFNSDLVIEISGISTDIFGVAILNTQLVDNHKLDQRHLFPVSSKQGEDKTKITISKCAHGESAQLYLHLKLLAGLKGGGIANLSFATSDSSPASPSPATPSSPTPSQEATPPETQETETGPPPTSLGQENAASSPPTNPQTGVSENGIIVSHTVMNPDERKMEKK